MAQHNSLGDLFSDIADAIRARIGGNATIVADDFPDKIDDVYDAAVTATKVGTASAADVLPNKTFTNSTAVGISGAMPVQSTWTWSTYSGASPLYGLNGSNFYMKFPANKYWTTVGALEDYAYTQIPTTCFGTAAAADVKNGVTFTSTAGVKQTGTFTHSSTYNVTNQYNTTVDLTTWHSYRYLKVRSHYSTFVTASRGSSATIKMSSPYSGTGQLQNYTYYVVPSGFYVTHIAVLAWHIAMNALVNFAGRRIYCRVDSTTWAPTLTTSTSAQTTWTSTNYGWYRGTYASSYLYPNSTAYFPDSASSGTTRLLVAGQFK